MALDLSTLSPDDLVTLKQLLGLQQDDPRSAMWKPLHDLRPATTAKTRLYRPHFEFSAEDDGQQVIPGYPKLYWDAQGREQRVLKPDMPIPAAWTDVPPLPLAVDPTAQIQAEFDTLSPEDQAFVIESQRQARLHHLNELIAGVPAIDLNALAGRTPPAAKAAKTAKAAKA
jgi:hypothetical protein